MLDLSQNTIPVLHIFKPLFSKSVWLNLLILIWGTILAKGPRTISAALRAMGFHEEKNFHKFHWVLNGAKWSALKASKILFGFINRLLPFTEPLVVIFDETLEPRYGEKIKGLSRYLHSAKSNKGAKVFSFGLKWLVAAVSFKFPWSDRTWALPFLTHLTLSEKALNSSKNKWDKNRKFRHKPFTERTMTLMRLIKKWTGNCRKLVFVADSAFNTYAIANYAIILGAIFISNMKWDSALYDFPPYPISGKRGRPRKRGQRQPSLREKFESTQKWQKAKVKWYGGKVESIEFITGTAIWHSWGYPYTPIRWVIVRSLAGQFKESVLSCTDLEMRAEEIIEIFVQRWGIEVTFEEVKQNLGLGTQKHWSDKAVDRATPALFSLFSILNLMALESQRYKSIKPQSTAWYQKSGITFSDILHHIRQLIWRQNLFHRSLISPNPKKNIQDLDIDTLLYHLANTS